MYNFCLVFVNPKNFRPFFYICFLKYYDIIKVSFNFGITFFTQKTIYKRKEKN